MNDQNKLQEYLPEEHPPQGHSEWQEVPQSHGGLRRERTPVALSTGFGFGAARIREEAQSVARNAAERKESRVRELLNESASVMVNSSHHFPAPQNNSPAPLLETQLTRTTMVRTPAPQRAMYTPPKPILATRGRAFFAWVLDGIAAASAFVIAMGANYALVPEGISGTVATTIANGAKSLGAENPFFVVLLVRVMLSTGVLVFLGQAVVLLLTGSTAGRYAMGIFLARSSAKKRLADIFFSALSEAATVGGILTLPLLFLMPSRAPLAPWVRFEQSE